MKRLIAFGFSYCIAHAYAGTSSVNIGPSMTTGPASNSYSLSAAQNPAMTSLVIDEEENWRLSFAPSFSIGTELGEVDNFADDLDELIDILDDPTLLSEETDDALDRFNAVLLEMGESGYLKQSISTDLPFLPLYHRSGFLNGSIGISANVKTQIGLRILDDSLAFDQIAGFETNTSLYLKSGIQTALGLSYSRPIFSGNSTLSKYGKLYGGVKLNLYQLELSKQILPIQQLDGAEVEDVVEDQYDQNLETTTNFGLDFGLVWDADRYRLGLTMENLNSPEFDYGSVGENCGQLEENTSARFSCESAREFIQVNGELKARETHTMHAKTRIDGLFKMTKYWSINASMDLAAYDDITGFENQWVHVATSFDSPNFIPGLRVGYQSNMTGGETQSLNAGITLFKYVHLDFEYGLNEVEVDGDKFPRRIGFGISVSENF